MKRFALSATVLIVLSACAPDSQATPSLESDSRVATKLRSALGSEQVLHVFRGKADGGQSTSGLIVDAAGNVYGTAAKGGRANAGVVFEFTRHGSARWKETILHSFSGGKDGGNPLAGLTMDATGNLYGTTSVGGNPSCRVSAVEPCGVVFELARGGGKWKETVLHAFGGKDGAYPVSAITFDKNGNIFGAAEEGGTITSSCIGGCGVVYELTRNANKWNETVLHTFAPSQGTDGEFPQSRPILDANGDLIGTTYLGEGSTSSGSVYELAPNGSGGWKETILHGFSPAQSAGGLNPSGDLVMDTSGNLVGTTSQGGTSMSFDGGVVYTLEAGSWSEHVVFDFNSIQQGLGPAGGVILDASGNMYGTTEFGSGFGCPNVYTGCGNVFELTPGGSETTVPLSRGQGYHPDAGLVFDTKGVLYGTARAGGDDLGCAGSNGCGSVFEITR